MGPRIYLLDVASTARLATNAHARAQVVLHVVVRWPEPLSLVRVPCRPTRMSILVQEDVVAHCRCPERSAALQTISGTHCPVRRLLQSTAVDLQGITIARAVLLHCLEDSQSSFLSVSYFEGCTKAAARSLEEAVDLYTPPSCSKQRHDRVCIGVFQMHDVRVYKIRTSLLARDSARKDSQNPPHHLITCSCSSGQPELPQAPSGTAVCERALP